MLRNYSKILMLILILSGSSDLKAQSADRVVRDFRRLELYMLRVWKIVENLNNPQATELMRQAKTELDQARELIFNSEHFTGRLIQAYQHITKARKLTDLAAKIVLRQPLDRLKSQLDDIIIKAENDVLRSNSDEALYLLERARIYRNKAYQAIQSGRANIGQEFYRIAYYFASKAIDLSSGDQSSFKLNFEELQIHLEEMFAHALQLIQQSQNQNLVRLLEDARSHFEEARNLYDAGNVTAALRQLRLIEKFLVRIIDQVEQDSDTVENQIRNNLSSLENFIRSIRSEFDSDTDQQSRAMLERAEFLYRQAKMNFEAGDFVRARQNMLLSQKIVNRLLRIDSDDTRDSYSDLPQRIEQTEKILELLSEKKSAGRDNSSASLLSTALNTIRQARIFYENGQPARAWQLTMLATRLASRLQKMMSEKPQQGQQNPDQISLKIANAENLLSAMNRYGSLDSNDREVLNQLSDFVAQAKSNLENGNFLIAEELIETTLNQIKYYSNLWRQRQSN